MKYCINDVRYAKAEKIFEEEFNKEWDKVLLQLKCQQSQLLLGNRLRPKIVFWGYVASKASSELDALSYVTIAQVAVSIELFHKASLLIDDWLDNDTARHGRKTFHVEFGAQYAVVFAVHIICLAIWRIKNIFIDNLADEVLYQSCIKKVSDIVYGMSLGALKELQLEHEELYDIEKIKTIAHFETAEIIEKSLQIGYILGGTNNENVSAILKVIGSQCGYLFQTLNDLEAFSNLEKNAEHKGYTNFDIDNNRKNIVVSMLWELASSKDQKIIQNSCGADIFHIAQKYHLKSFVLKDMEIVYTNMITNINSLRNYGICEDWINSFSDFFSQIRDIAYNRL